MRIGRTRCIRRAETDSFARAAELLGYTQAAVSQQVAALGRLVDRLIPPRVVVLAWRKGRQLGPAQQAFVDVATTAHSRRRADRLAS